MATPISLTVGFVKTAEEDPLGCGSSRLAASSQSDPEVFSRFLKDVPHILQIFYLLS
jgi:hypothetical protein